MIAKITRRLSKTIKRAADILGGNTSPLKLLRAALLAGENETAIEIYLAMKDGHSLVEELDISALFPFTRQGDQTPLHLASENALKGIILLFLNHGGNPNAPNARNETSLHALLSRSENAALRLDLLNVYLLWRGVSDIGESTVFDVNTGQMIPSEKSYGAGSVLGASAAPANVYEGSEVVSINHVDKLGNAALHFASSNGLLECVEVLLSNGAIISLVNCAQQTCCELADMARHVSLADMLEAALVFQPEDPELALFQQQIQDSSDYSSEPHMEVVRGGRAGGASKDMSTLMTLDQSFSLSTQQVEAFMDSSIKLVQHMTYNIPTKFPVSLSGTQAEALLASFDWNVKTIQTKLTHANSSGGDNSELNAIFDAAKLTIVPLSPLASSDLVDLDMRASSSSVGALVDQPLVAGEAPGPGAELLPPKEKRRSIALSDGDNGDAWDDENADSVWRKIGTSDKVKDTSSSLADSEWCMSDGVRKALSPLFASVGNLAAVDVHLHKLIASYPFLQLHSAEETLITMRNCDTMRAGAAEPGTATNAGTAAADGSKPSCSICSEDIDITIDTVLLRNFTAGNKRVTSARSAQHWVGEVMCTIKRYPDIKLAVVCFGKHEYCMDCWTQSIQSQVNEGLAVSLSCPGFKCGECLDLHVFGPLLFPPENQDSTGQPLAESTFLTRLRDLRHRRRLDNCTCLRMCPVADCGVVLCTDILPKNIVASGGNMANLENNLGPVKPLKHSSTWRVSGGDGRGVESTPVLLLPRTAVCASGHCFCVLCSGEAHAPCTCDQWSAWQKKVAKVLSVAGINGNSNGKDSKGGSGGDDIANALWVAANTKRCPRCTTPIEKDEGCNHMSCRKCRHEFCWICLQEWSLHSSETGGYFQCNRFVAGGASPGEDDEEEDLDETGDGSSNQETMRLRTRGAVMSRFIHHFTRYSAHSDSVELELRMRQETICRLQFTLLRSSNTYLDHHSNTTGAGGSQSGAPIIVPTSTPQSTSKLMNLLGSGGKGTPGSVGGKDRESNLSSTKKTRHSGDMGAKLTDHPPTTLKWLQGVHEVNPYDGLAIEPLSEMLVTAAENLRLAIGPDRRGETNYGKSEPPAASPSPPAPPPTPACLLFLKDGFEELFYCRQILRGSYIFSFFSFGTDAASWLKRKGSRGFGHQPNQEHFEQLQSELEEMAEMLSDVVARRRLRASKAQITNAVSLAHRKRKEFEVAIKRHMEDAETFKHRQQVSRARTTRSTSSSGAARDGNTPSSARRGGNSASRGSRSGRPNAEDINPFHYNSEDQDDELDIAIAMSVMEAQQLQQFMDVSFGGLLSSNANGAAISPQNTEFAANGATGSDSNSLGSSSSVGGAANYSNVTSSTGNVSETLPPLMTQEPGGHGEPPLSTRSVGNSPAKPIGIGGVNMTRRPGRPLHTPSPELHRSQSNSSSNNRGMLNLRFSSYDGFDRDRHNSQERESLSSYSSRLGSTTVDVDGADVEVNSTVSIDRTSPMSFQESLSDHNEPHRHTGVVLRSSRSGDRREGGYPSHQLSSHTRDDSSESSEEEDSDQDSYDGVSSMCGTTGYSGANGSVSSRTSRIADDDNNSTTSTHTANTNTTSITNTTINRPSMPSVTASASTSVVGVGARLGDSVMEEEGSSYTAPPIPIDTILCVEAVVVAEEDPNSCMDEYYDTSTGLLQAFPVSAASSTSAAANAPSTSIDPSAPAIATPSVGEPFAVEAKAVVWTNGQGTGSRPRTGSRPSNKPRSFFPPEEGGVRSGDGGDEEHMRGRSNSIGSSSTNQSNSTTSTADVHSSMANNPNNPPPPCIVGELVGRERLLPLYREEMLLQQQQRSSRKQVGDVSRAAGTGVPRPGYARANTSYKDRRPRIYTDQSDSLEFRRPLDISNLPPTVSPTGRSDKRRLGDRSRSMAVMHTSSTPGSETRTSTTRTNSSRTPRNERSGRMLGSSISQPLAADDSSPSAPPQPLLVNTGAEDATAYPLVLPPAALSPGRAGPITPFAINLNTDGGRGPTGGRNAASASPASTPVRPGERGAARQPATPSDGGGRSAEREAGGSVSEERFRQNMRFRMRLAEEESLNRAILMSLSASDAAAAGGDVDGPGPGEEALNTLCSMGFARDVARQALIQSKNNIERATDRLLNGT